MNNSWVEEKIKTKNTNGLQVNKQKHIQTTIHQNPSGQIEEQNYWP